MDRDGSSRRSWPSPFNPDIEIKEEHASLSPEREDADPDSDALLNLPIPSLPSPFGNAPASSGSWNEAHSSDPSSLDSITGQPIQDLSVLGPEHFARPSSLYPHQDLIVGADTAPNYFSDFQHQLVSSSSAGASASQATDDSYNLNLLDKTRFGAGLGDSNTVSQSFEPLGDIDGQYLGLGIGRGSELSSGPIAPSSHNPHGMHAGTLLQANAGVHHGGDGPLNLLHPDRITCEGIRAQTVHATDESRSIQMIYDPEPLRDVRDIRQALLGMWPQQHARYGHGNHTTNAGVSVVRRISRTFPFQGQGRAAPLPPPDPLIRNPARPQGFERYAQAQSPWPFPGQGRAAAPQLPSEPLIRNPTRLQGFEQHARAQSPWPSSMNFQGPAQTTLHGTQRSNAQVGRNIPQYTGPTMTVPLGFPRTSTVPNTQNQTVHSICQPQGSHQVQPHSNLSGSNFHGQVPAAASSLQQYARPTMTDTPGFLETSRVSNTQNQTGYSCIFHNIGQPQGSHQFRPLSNLSGGDLQFRGQVPPATSSLQQSQCSQVCGPFNKRTAPYTAPVNPAISRRTTSPPVRSGAVQAGPSLSRFGQQAVQALPIPTQTLGPIRWGPRHSQPRAPMRGQASRPLSARARSFVPLLQRSTPAVTSRSLGVHNIPPRGRPRDLALLIDPHANVPPSALSPPHSPVDRIRHQGEKHQLIGKNCYICKRDLSYPPEGPLIENPALLPGAAVLPCGHAFHEFCLDQITPEDQKSDPPCIPCAMGEEA